MTPEPTCPTRYEIQDVIAAHVRAVEPILVQHVMLVIQRNHLDALILELRAIHADNYPQRRRWGVQ